MPPLHLTLCIVSKRVSLSIPSLPSSSLTVCALPTASHPPLSPDSFLPDSIILSLPSSTLSPPTPPSFHSSSDVFHLFLPSSFHAALVRSSFFPSSLVLRTVPLQPYSAFDITPSAVLA